MIVRYPFDWRNPFGYSIAFTLQYITLAYVFQFIALIASMGIGVFLLTISMVKDLKYTAKALNKFNKNKSLSLEQFYEFIQYYSIVKQLSLYPWNMEYIWIEIKKSI